jgi:hypothetical protein
VSFNRCRTEDDCCEGWTSDIPITLRFAHSLALTGAGLIEEQAVDPRYKSRPGVGVIHRQSRLLCRLTVSA